MLPLATLAGLLSKLVRDLCRDQGKEAELTIRGEEVTIDKRILEQMKDRSFTCCATASTTASRRRSSAAARASHPVPRSRSRYRR
jgi:two-component system chemotaxis sensor kinase CheA